MKTIISIISFCFCSSSILLAGLLDSKVPWSGKVRHTDFASMVTRMQGWSEGQGLESLRLIGSSPKNIDTKEIRNLVISDKPRPTYHDVLTAVFKSVGHNVVLVETKQGISVTYLYHRIIQLNYEAKDRLKRAKLLSSAGIVSKMRSNGVKVTSHHRIKILPGMDSFVVSGTLDDLNNTARFFGE